MAKKTNFKKLFKKPSKVVSEEHEVVGNMLTEASKYGLMTEVVVSAMNFHKENPELSIETACSAGLNEWVK